MPFECLAKISASTRESIPGRGIKVPRRKTINAKTVNNRRFFKSVALLKTDASIFAAIFSANDTIFISLKLLLVSRIGEKNPSPSLFELNT